MQRSWSNQPADKSICVGEVGMVGGLLKSASSTALFAALGLIALGAGAPAAKAADLGGDCCADLEERVAELEATTARKGNRKVSLTISGQVTTAVMYWNDGNRHDVYIVDPPVAGGTLFNLNGKAKISPALSAGFHIQIGLDNGGRSHQVTATDDDGGAPGDTTMVMKLANWYLDHKSLGRVTVGRITTATSGISGINLGGTSVIATVNIGYWQRSFSATNDATGGLLAGTWTNLLGGATVNSSTLSRANAISYASPTFGGFSVAAAWGEDNVWDAALRYAGEFSGFRVAAGIGYINNSSGLNEVTPDQDDCALPAAGKTATCRPSQWKGSASILHVATGLFATGAYVRQDNASQTKTSQGALIERPDTQLFYLQGGIAKNWTGLGNTVFYGEWARVDDGATGRLAPAFGGLNNFVFISDSTATVWGLGVVQHIDTAAMELFLSFRRYSADITGCDTSGGGACPGPTPGVAPIADFDVVMGGARIKF
jgi:hypothetical protein